MLKGVIFLLLAALSFSFSTVFAKMIVLQSNVPAFEIVFFRFLIGFPMILGYVLVTKKPLRPKRMDWVILRACFNFGVVAFLFLGVQFTTITKANMLNLTYPVFVFVVAPFMNKEKARLSNYLFLFVTIIGVYLVTLPDFTHINVGDLYALISGIIGGFSISSVREARKYDENYLIIFYLMAIGLLGNFLLMLPIFVIPEGKIFFNLVFSAAGGFLGQIFTTMGFHYIEAPTGALLTASRLLFATLLGVSLFGDPLTFRILSGGMLILISLIGVSGVITFPNRR